MAEIKHDWKNDVGVNYDATSDAPVSGWEKLNPPGDVANSAPATGNAWKQV